MMIIEPGNLVFHVFLFAVAAFVFALVAVHRNCGYAARRRVMITFSIILFIYYWVYKYQISVDPEYAAVLAENGIHPFTWWDEMPFNVCNVMLILLPLAAILESETLYRFIAAGSGIGAAFAVIMPYTGYSGFSVLTPRIFGYYLTHFLIMMFVFLIEGLGMVRLRLRDIPKLLLVANLLNLAVFGFNMFLRYAGIYPDANFFFNVEPINFLYEISWNMTPVPFVFSLLPFAICSVPWYLVTCGVSQLVLADSENKIP